MHGGGRSGRLLQNKLGSVRKPAFTKKADFATPSRFTARSSPNRDEHGATFQTLRQGEHGKTGQFTK